MPEVDAKAAYHRTLNGSLANFPHNLENMPPKAVDAFRQQGARTAYTFREKKLVRIMYLHKKDQEFKNYATDWEILHSTILSGDGAGTVDPVVDENMTVIGHYGKFDSQYIFVPGNIIPHSAKTVEEKIPILWPGARVVEVRKMDLSLPDYLAAEADVIADEYHEARYFNRGYRRYELPQTTFTVITDIEGHVMLVVDSQDKQGLKPALFSPLDLISIVKLVVLGVAAVGGALIVRTLARRRASRTLAAQAGRRELTDRVADSAGTRVAVQPKTGRTLVVGRGTTSKRSQVPDVGTPETMDFQKSAKAHHQMRLENALQKNPSLRGQFEDVFVERIGINPNNPLAGMSSTGLTPAGVESARDLLQPGGTLRILQSPGTGQTLSEVEGNIRGMLAKDFTNISVSQHREEGTLHLLVTATKR